jgi:hypothetical protein
MVLDAIRALAPRGDDDRRQDGNRDNVDIDVRNV